MTEFSSWKASALRIWALLGLRAKGWECELSVDVDCNLFIQSAILGLAFVGQSCKQSFGGSEYHLLPCLYLLSIDFLHAGPPRKVGSISAKSSQSTVARDGCLGVVMRGSAYRQFAHPCRWRRCFINHAPPGPNWLFLQNSEGSLNNFDSPTGVS